MPLQPATPPAHHGHEHGHVHGHDGRLAEVLELDARVLPFTPRLVELVASSLTGPPTRVVDLGAGSGAGARALAARFPEADVTAVDRSPVMVDRLRVALQATGLAPRISVVHADVDAGWAPPQPVDLVWASAVLHEVADPGGVMAAVRSALRPEGTFAVVEMDAPPCFLPEDAGPGGAELERRLHAALATSGGRAAHPRWAGALVEAGFTEVTEEQVSVEATSPLPLLRRFATAYLSLVVPALPGRLAAEDLAAIDELLSAQGPHALTTRTDLRVRATRTLWTARRP